MATARLDYVKVRHDGRSAELQCTFLPAPGDLHAPDNRIALANGRALTIGGRQLVYRGHHFRNCSIMKPFMQAYVPLGGLGSVDGFAFGCRYGVLCLSDTPGGAETDRSEIAGGWQSTPGSDDGYGINVSTGMRLRVWFQRGGIPAGKYGQLYLTKTPNVAPTAENLGLYRADIAPGTPYVDVDRAAFDNADRSPIETLMSWTGVYFVKDSAQIITYLETVAGTLRATAPLGLMQCRNGHQSPAFTDALVESWSYMDESGFVDVANIPPGPTGRRFYIGRPGNPKASNDNDGLTPDTPLATIAALTNGGSGLNAVERNRLKGGGCIIHLQDSTNESDTAQAHISAGSNFNKGYGLDHARPLLITRYHDDSDGPDEGNRPLVMNGASSNGTPQDCFAWSSPENLNTHTFPPPEHFVIEGATFISNPSFDTVGAKAAIQNNNGMFNFLVHDCLFNAWGTPIGFNGSVNSSLNRSFGENCSVLRSSIFDSNAHGPSGRAQALHTSWCHNLLLGELFCHSNGFRTIEAQVGNGLDHQWYLNMPTTMGIYRHNMLVEGSFAGIGARGGGVCFDNLIFDCSALINMINYGGSIARNVLGGARPIKGVSTTGGGGITFSTGAPTAVRALVEENLILDAAFVKGVGALALANYTFSPGQGHALPIELIQIRNNTVRNGGPIRIGQAMPVTALEFDSNIVDCTGTNEGTVVEGHNSALIGDWSFATGDHNVYASAAPSAFASLPGISNFQTWKSVSGLDTNGLFLSSVEYANGTYNKDSFAMEKGWANWAAMVAGLRARRRRTWGSAYSMEGGYELWCDAFTPKSLVAYGGGPFDFPGAVPTPALSTPTFTIEGPITMKKNQPALFTVTPSAASSDSLALSDDPAIGSFAPPSLTWSADTSARVFHYTPTESGVVTLSLRRAGVELAQRALSVKDGGLMASKKQQRLDANLSPGLA